MRTLERIFLLDHGLNIFQVQAEYPLTFELTDPEYKMFKNGIFCMVVEITFKGQAGGAIAQIFIQLIGGKLKTLE